jgi:hypothetical protein
VATVVHAGPESLIDAAAANEDDEVISGGNSGKVSLTTSAF